jgi:hypothetical protein
LSFYVENEIELWWVNNNTVKMRRYGLLGFVTMDKIPAKQILEKSKFMKALLLSIVLGLVAAAAGAQTCKIRIYYDNNGNRIQRILDCTGPKPAPAADSIPDPALVRANISPGLDGNREAGFAVYPNPAAHRVNVKLDAGYLAQSCSITLTDITGKALYQVQKVNAPLSTIDLGPYADGVYFIVLQRGAVRNAVRIVKQSGNGY